MAGGKKSRKSAQHGSSDDTVALGRGMHPLRVVPVEGRFVLVTRTKSGELHAQGVPTKEDAAVWWLMKVVGEEGEGT